MEALVTVQESAVQMQSVFDSGLFQRFVNYIDREPTTVKGYITCLRRFAEWLQKNQIRQPQRADILTYKKYLNSESFGRPEAQH